ncbi:MAG: hypothetical protein U0W40_16840 [Acidimicrobiia bacterium]
MVNKADRLGIARGVMEKVTGISAAVPPNFAKVRSPGGSAQPRAAAATEGAPRSLFPTCMVEYQDPAIGKALVGVYEHNRIRW